MIKKWLDILLGKNDGQFSSNEKDPPDATLTRYHRVEDTGAESTRWEFSVSPAWRILLAYALLGVAFAAMACKLAPALRLALLAVAKST